MSCTTVTKTMRKERFEVYVKGLTKDERKAFKTIKRHCKAIKKAQRRLKNMKIAAAKKNAIAERKAEREKTRVERKNIWKRETGEEYNLKNYWSDVQTEKEWEDHDKLVNEIVEGYKNSPESSKGIFGGSKNDENWRNAVYNNKTLSTHTQNVYASILTSSYCNFLKNIITMFYLANKEGKPSAPPKIKLITEITDKHIDYLYNKDNHYVINGEETHRLHTTVLKHLYVYMKTEEIILWNPRE